MVASATLHLSAAPPRKVQPLEGSQGTLLRSSDDAGYRLLEHHRFVEPKFGRSMLLVLVAKPLYGLTPVSGVRIPPLRHTVCVAENPGCTPLRIAENRRIPATFALKPDRRKCPAVSHEQAFMSFSLKGIVAVRFHRLRQANAMRSQTDGAAKAT